MEKFTTFLGGKKAHYYRKLYLSGNREEVEHIDRMRTVDEYVLLLDVIGHLPIEVQRRIDAVYKDSFKR